MPSEPKAALRQDAKARRAALHQAHGTTAPAAALHRLHATPGLATAFAPGTCVSGYWPVGSEFDPRPILEDCHTRGLACALPVSHARGTPLEFRRWTTGCEMTHGALGIAVPAAGAERLTPRVLLVPLLAVDETGHRLGYGAAYYDVTLRALRADGPAVAVGLAFEGQVVEALPADDHDERLDWLVTEAAVRRFG